MMEFGNLSSILPAAEVSHVSETPPSSPSGELLVNTFGSNFEFHDTPSYSDYRKTNTEVGLLSIKETMVTKKKNC